VKDHDNHPHGGSSDTPTDIYTPRLTNSEEGLTESAPFIDEYESHDPRLSRKSPGHSRVTISPGSNQRWLLRTRSRSSAIIGAGFSCTCPNEAGWARFVALERHRTLNQGLLPPGTRFESTAGHANSRSFP
jgi:hypothetical protein